MAHKGSATDSCIYWREPVVYHRGCAGAHLSPSHSGTHVHTRSAHVYDRAAQVHTCTSADRKTRSQKWYATAQHGKQTRDAEARSREEERETRIHASICVKLSCVMEAVQAHTRASSESSCRKCSASMAPRLRTGPPSPARVRASGRAPPDPRAAEWSARAATHSYTR